MWFIRAVVGCYDEKGTDSCFLHVPITSTRSTITGLAIVLDRGTVPLI